MTEPIPPRNRQTDYLFLLLGNLGFEAPAEPPSTVGPSDGYVIHRELGIWIHADPEMIRLVVGPHGDQAGYRLVLGRNNLRRGEALDIIAVHARAAVAERR